MVEELNFDFDEKYLKELPYFDFIYAINESGFDFEDFMADNFKDFIKEFIDNYTKVRKFFILRDLVNYKRAAHSLKGIFR